MATSEARARAPRRADSRIDDEPAFVLHCYPYKETSLIAEVLTRHYGRVALVARGAKRPRSVLRGLLMSFQPLAVSFASARGRTQELSNLARAEWVGGLAALRGRALICGFYLNELLIKMLARHDPHPSLFDGYAAALAGLATGAAPAPVLRAFEYTLLRETGYAIHLAHDEQPTAIEPEVMYRYVAERGPLPAALAGEDGSLVCGKTLTDIEAGDFSDPVTLAQSKHLMRQLINHQLAGQALHTRQIMIELHDL